MSGHVPFKLDKTQPPPRGDSAGGYLHEIMVLDDKNLWAKACAPGLMFIEEVRDMWPHEALAKAMETAEGRGYIRWLAKHMFGKRVSEAIAAANAGMLSQPNSPTWSRDYSFAVTKEAAMALAEWIDQQEATRERETEASLVEMRKRWAQEDAP